MGAHGAGWTHPKTKALSASLLRSAFLRNRCSDAPSIGRHTSSTPALWPDRKARAAADIRVFLLPDAAGLAAGDVGSYARIRRADQMTRPRSRCMAARWRTCGSVIDHRLETDDDAAGGKRHHRRSDAGVFAAAADNPYWMGPRARRGHHAASALYHVRLARIVIGYPKFRAVGRTLRMFDDGRRGLCPHRAWQHHRSGKASTVRAGARPLSRSMAGTR